MNLRPRPLLAVAMFALGVVSTPALSQDAGWFIGAGGGYADAKQGCPPEPFVPGFACDDKSVAWRAFGGYRFNAYFGYEIGYADLGKITRSFAGDVGTFEATAIDALLFVAVPLGQDFSFFVKGGIFSWDFERTIVGTGAGKANEKGTDTTYGFGAQYDLGKNLALRLEWQRYNDVGDVNAFGQTHIEVSLISAVLRF